LVRFRDPNIAEDLFGVSLSSMDFTLIEVIGASTGGAV
jgi:hypothetical protein